MVDQSSVGNRFGFQGRPRDPETGFVYFRNRYYDPEIGRFLTPDPLGYGDGPNLYQFAGSNPLDQSDPLGLYCRECAIELERRAERIRRRREQREDAETLRSGKTLVNQLAGQPGVTTEILQRALMAHLLSRPRVDRYEAAQLTASLTARLTGVGPSNQLNPVAGELKGMRRSARFAELYPVIFLGMADAGDLVFGVRDLATLVRRVGVRGALHEMSLGLGEAAEVAAEGGAARGTRLLPDVSRTGQLTQEGLDHIVLRHFPSSGSTNAGKFAPEITVRQLRSMIGDALERGSIRHNTAGRPGQIFEFDFGRQIGVDPAGKPATRLRVVRMPDGTIKTAFPF